MPIYAQNSDVARVLGVDAFTGASKPSSQEIDKFIEEAEDWIDDETGHAWRIRTISKFEEHEIGRLGVRQSWFTWRGYPVYLNHRDVKTFSAALGDKFEVLEAVDTFVDWLPKTTQWELDVDYGIVYIKQLFLGSRRGFWARFKYRYGDVTVPKDIRHATAKLAALWVVQSSDMWDILPGGSNNIVAAREKVDIFRKEVNDILARYTELASPH